MTRNPYLAPVPPCWPRRASIHSLQVDCGSSVQKRYILWSVYSFHLFPLQSGYTFGIPYIYKAGFKLLNAPFEMPEVVKNSATITNWKCIAKVVFQNESTTPDKVWWGGGGLIHFVLLPKLKVSDYRTTITTCSMQGSRNCCCYLIGCVLSRYRPRSCCSWWWRWWWWRRIMILLCNKPLLNYFPYIQKKKRSPFDTQNFGQKAQRGHINELCVCQKSITSVFGHNGMTSIGTCPIVREEGKWLKGWTKIRRK